MSQFNSDTLKEESDPRINDVVLFIGNINQRYVVRNTIFVMGYLGADLFDPAFPNEDLFLIAERKLKLKIPECGANAAINCHFKYQQRSRAGKYFLELFAYETMI